MWVFRFALLTMVLTAVCAAGTGRAVGWWARSVVSEVVDGLEIPSELAAWSLVEQSNLLSQDLLKLLEG